MTSVLLLDEEAVYSFLFGNLHVLSSVWLICMWRRVGAAEDLLLGGARTWGRVSLVIYSKPLMYTPCRCGSGRSP